MAIQNTHILDRQFSVTAGGRLKERDRGAHERALIINPGNLSGSVSSNGGGGEVPKIKRRRADGDAEESSPKDSKQGRLKKKTSGRRVGPSGLSLAAFAAAKSKPLINPARNSVCHLNSVTLLHSWKLRGEHREFYKNAKKVQNYKKGLKEIGGEGHSVVANIEQSSEWPVWFLSTYQNPQLLLST